MTERSKGGISSLKRRLTRTSLRAVSSEILFFFEWAVTDGFKVWLSRIYVCNTVYHLLIEESQPRYINDACRRLFDLIF